MGTAATRKAPVILVLALALALVAMGCGSSNDDDGVQPTAAAPTATEAAAPSTPVATPAPTAEPTAAPTAAPTAEPTAAPTAEATAAPTEAPTEEPTPEPEPVLYSEAGPHPVGTMTLVLGDEADQRIVEVWYPTTPDAVAGLETYKFDSSSAIPEAFRSLLPSELQSIVETNAYRDVPVAPGEYPVVIYSHGFGGHRNVAIYHTVHLASWGFVVASTEHTHRNLQAQSFGTARSDPEADMADIADTLAALDEALPGSADTSRTGVIGHSAGAFTAVLSLTNDSVLTAVALTGGGSGTIENGDKPVLIISAELDQVVPPERGLALFEALTGPRSFVVLAQAGHNSFTDSCPQILSMGGLGILEPLLGAEQVGRAEDGCTPDFADPALTFASLNHLATSQFLSVLAGVDAPITPEFSDLIGIGLADYREAG